MTGEKRRPGWDWSSWLPSGPFWETLRCIWLALLVCFLFLEGRSNQQDFERAQNKGHFEQTTGKARYIFIFQPSWQTRSALSGTRRSCVRWALACHRLWWRENQKSLSRRKLRCNHRLLILSSSQRPFISDWNVRMKTKTGWPLSHQAKHWLLTFA